MLSDNYHEIPILIKLLLVLKTALQTCSFILKLRPSKVIRCDVFIA